MSKVRVFSCLFLALFFLLSLLHILSAQALADEQLQAQWRRAIRLNNTALIRHQIDQISDINLTTDNGKTALMAAAYKGDHHLVSVLLSAGANIHLNNKTQGSPLLYAAAHGDTKTLQLLLKHGAQINHQSSNGWTALMMATAKRHQHSVALLCQHNADVNLADVYGWTPLMRAAYEGYPALVELLLQQKIDIERHNDHGQTALHLAVINNRITISQSLLSKGAQQKADFAGHTPRSMAQQLGHRKLLNLLNQH